MKGLIEDIKKLRLCIKKDEMGYLQLRKFEKKPPSFLVFSEEEIEFLDDSKKEIVRLRNQGHSFTVIAKMINKGITGSCVGERYRRIVKEIENNRRANV
jgi:hypothetical protein